MTDVKSARPASPSAAADKHMSNSDGGTEEIDEEFKYLAFPIASTDAGSTGISTPATTPPPPDSANFHGRKSFTGPSPRLPPHSSPIAPPPKLPLPALPISPTFSSPRSSTASSYSHNLLKSAKQQSAKRGHSNSPSPPGSSSGQNFMQKVPRESHPSQQSMQQRREVLSPASTVKSMDDRTIINDLSSPSSRKPSRTPSRQATHQRQMNSIEDAHRRAAVVQQQQQQQQGSTMPKSSTFGSLYEESLQSHAPSHDYEGQATSRRGPSASAHSKASFAPRPSSNGSGSSSNRSGLVLNTNSAPHHHHHQHAHYANSRILTENWQRAHSPEALHNGDDVVMNDGSSLLEDTIEEQTDFDENDFEYLTQPNGARPTGFGAAPQASMQRHDSSRTDKFEAAWADDASVIDFNEHDEESEYQASNPGEAFEVAALRRQVEQLQMALQRQMAPAAAPRMSTKSVSHHHSDPRAHRGAGNARPAYGMPLPSKSYDNMHAQHHRSGSSKADNRATDSYSELDQYELSNAHGDAYNNDRRRLVIQPHRSQQQLSHPYMDTGHTPSRKSKRSSGPSNASSVVAEESRTVSARNDDAQKVDELAKKIEALERMFQSSSVSLPSGHNRSPMDERQPMYHSPIDMRLPSFDPNSPTSPTAPRGRYPGQARPDMPHPAAAREESRGTMSSRENGSLVGRRSPAASAFHFNPTPYSEKEYGQSMRRLDNNSSSGSINTPNARTKSVARFIMGVGSSRSNVPRDEHGNPLPSMQVSWSRKRTEKVAKPTTNAKMKVGPGRGRIVMKPQAPSGPSSM